MNLTTIVDFADEFGRTREDANNALKRYVHPDCIPPTAAGQMRMLSEGEAKLLAFALQARAAGYSPEHVRSITRQCAGQIMKDQAAIAVLTPDGGCEVHTKRVSEKMTLADLIGPFRAAHVARVAIIDLAALGARVGAAIEKTAESFGQTVRKQQVESGWTGERKVKVGA
jgi:hypothetical protein